MSAVPFQLRGKLLLAVSDWLALLSCTCYFPQLQPNLKPAHSGGAAMPQYCSGLQDPCGGPARPCVFASSGNGSRASIKKQRDGNRCPFCCPGAWDRGWCSYVGRGHIVKRLSAWLKASSPVYEAAFSLGCPGLLLSLDDQLQLRRRAGEAPTIRFDLRSSWAHKKPSRLQHLRSGRPIPPAPPLTEEARQFLYGERRGRLARQKRSPWAKAIRAQVRVFCRNREDLSTSRTHRREWWRVRRVIRARLQEAASGGPPYDAAVLWAFEEGILPAPV